MNHFVCPLILGGVNPGVDIGSGPGRGRVAHCGREDKRWL
jgi:hypothetical protein